MVIVATFNSIAVSFINGVLVKTIYLSQVTGKQYQINILNILSWFNGDLFYNPFDLLLQKLLYISGSV